MLFLIQFSLDLFLLIHACTLWWQAHAPHADDESTHDLVAWCDWDVAHAAAADSAAAAEAVACSQGGGGGVRAFCSALDRASAKDKIAELDRLFTKVLCFAAASACAAIVIVHALA